MIIGIDLGFINTGYSILDRSGNKIILLDYGILSMKSNQSIPFRINYFYDFFNQKISEYNVEHLSLETPFLGKNAQNFLKLGYLRSILYLLAVKNNLKIFEFSPREIKFAITGFGAADKSQVARVICKFFPGLNMPNKLDVTDSISVSLCGLFKIKK